MTITMTAEATTSMPATTPPVPVRELAAVDSIFSCVRSALGRGHDHNLAFVRVVGSHNGRAVVRAYARNGTALGVDGELCRARLFGRAAAFETELPEDLVETAAHRCTRVVHTSDERAAVEVFSAVDRMLAGRVSNR